MTESDLIYNRVKKFITSRSLILKGDRVLLAVSAGKDSMAMFHILMSLRDDVGFEAALFHLNHQMRGQESDDDEKHVRDLSEQFSIECYIERYDFSSASGKLSFEEHAREVRYKLLERTAADADFNRIATAHSLDDQVETIIMRFFTGTGLYGLRGIDPVRGKIIRPLLSLTSDEIYEFLKNRRHEWREDISNSDEKYLRNRIRKNLIPEIKKVFPSYSKAVSRIGELAGENNRILDELFFGMYSGIISSEGGNVNVNVDELDENIPMLKFITSHVLREYFNENSNFNMLQEVVRNFFSGRANNLLYMNKRVVIKKIWNNGRQFLSFTLNNHPIPVPVKWEYVIELMGSERLELEIVETGFKLQIFEVEYKFFKKNRSDNTIFVSIGNDTGTIIIRNRLDGDRIKLPYGTKKIKDVLIEKKLDNERKNCVPLIIISSAIAACYTGIFEEHGSIVAVDHFVTDKSERILAIRKIDS